MTAELKIKGMVGINPELTSFDKSENKKVRFTLAKQDFYQGKKFTTWYDCEAWNGNTQLVLDRIEKGQLVEVIGDLSIRPYYSKKHKENREQKLLKIKKFKILEKDSKDELVVEELGA